MLVQTMSTDGGAHPPEKWALVTARQIFQIDPKVEGSRLLKAQAFQLQIAEIMAAHHGDHQANERMALKERGDDHLDAPHDPSDRAREALAQIVAAAQATPWADHWNDETVQAASFAEIASHLATSAKEERMHHCDRTGSERARSWKSALQDGAVPNGEAVELPGASPAPQDAIQ